MSLRGLIIKTHLLSLFHSPRSCRAAVFLIQTNVSLGTYHHHRKPTFLSPEPGALDGPVARASIISESERGRERELFIREGNRTPVVGIGDAGSSPLSQKFIKNSRCQNYIHPPDRVPSAWIITVSLALGLRGNVESIPTARWYAAEAVGGAAVP